MNRKLVALLLLAGIAWALWNPPLSAPLAEEMARVVEAPTGFAAGVSIDNEPLQQDFSTHPTLQVDEYEFTLVADFQLEARVLGRRDYRRGAEARLSPIDLALGWGPMARDEIIDQISIRQRGRFYFWRVESYPIEHAAIVRNSANMHMIPASPEVFPKSLPSSSAPNGIVTFACAAFWSTSSDRMAGTGAPRRPAPTAGPAPARWSW